MFRLLILLPSLLIMTVATQIATQTSSSAESVTTAPATTNSSIPRMSPYDVIFMAYQGGFREQGIRGYGAFIEGCYQGQLTAKKIVAAAIKANRLPADAIDDQAYLKAIDSNLVSLKSNGRP